MAEIIDEYGNFIVTLVVTVALFSIGAFWFYGGEGNTMLYNAAHMVADGDENGAADANGVSGRPQGISSDHYVSTDMSNGENMIREKSAQKTSDWVQGTAVDPRKQPSIEAKYSIVSGQKVRAQLKRYTTYDVYDLVSSLTNENKEIVRRGITSSAIGASGVIQEGAGSSTSYKSQSSNNRGTDTTQDVAPYLRIIGIYDSNMTPLVPDVTEYRQQNINTVCGGSWTSVSGSAGHTEYLTVIPQIYYNTYTRTSNQSDYVLKCTTENGYSTIQFYRYGTYIIHVKAVDERGKSTVGYVHVGINRDGTDGIK